MFVVVYTYFLGIKFLSLFWNEDEQVVKKVSKTGVWEIF